MSVFSGSTVRPGRANPTGPLRPRGRKGELRREEILEAAVRVFAEHGYERASIDKVCAAVGCARGTLYQYFTDKQALFRATLEAYVARFRTHMRPPDELGGEVPRDRGEIRRLLEERFRRIFGTIAQDRDHYRLLFREALAKNADAGDLVREYDQQLLEMMVGEIRALVAAGLATLESPEFTANFFLGALLKTAQEYILEAEVPADTGELSRRTADLVCRALFASGQ